MKKIILSIISLFTFIMPLYAVSSSEVDYEIEDYIVDARIDMMGNLEVKEVLRIDGTYNGYIRDLFYKNIYLNEGELSNKYTWDTSIYNPTNLEIRKVGKIDWEGDLTYNVFESEISEFSECTDSTLCYEKTEVSDGISLKMFNETKRGTTYFYIEYFLGNAVVQHNDVAEIYYPFIGSGFDDTIENYQLRLVLPQPTKEDVRVWAHGPLTGEVFLMVEEDEETKDGGYLKVSDLDPNIVVDMRMTFPKEVIGVYFEGITKETKVDALDTILEIEQTKADEANEIRKKSRTLVYGTYALTGVYLLIADALIIFVYIKYDKEVKSGFDSEYNREFIDDYDVTVIEYLFNKKITEKAISTSILNLIYKKKIKVEEIEGKKKDYKFIKISEEDITPAEKKLMQIIFDDAGNSKEVKLSDIKEYAKKLNGTTSPFLSGYNSWNSLVKEDAVREAFYESNTKVKVYFSLYTLIGFLLIFLQVRYNINFLLTLLTLAISIFILIYMATFTKRTLKGSLHYAKWKAFKKFLDDFGRFDEKELPEIVLWERYLVYANIFGIADKVGKTMKIKFNELGYENTYNNRLTNYVIWNDLNHSVNRTVNSSLSTAHSRVSEAVAMSTNSSGSGFGGGFSGGSGFSGGGGGRGF